MRLTQEEALRYERDGFVVPNGRLPESTVVTLRAALDELLARNPGIPPEALDCAHLIQSAQVVRGHSAFFDLCVTPAILDCVEQLIGPDIILWSCHVFCKLPEQGREVPWHVDGEHWPIDPPATCSAWIAIDRSDGDNGCLQVIPGSHRLRIGQKRKDGYLVEWHDRVANDAPFREADAVDVTLEPGQMSFHDIHLIHGSRANSSSRRRAGVAIRYMPTTSLFDRTVEPRKSSRPENQVNFRDRPIWLVRGVDRCGKNTALTLEPRSTPE